MALYLPGPGYVGTARTTTVVGGRYVVVGPIGAGFWVRDVEVVVVGGATGGLIFGVVVGESGEASAVAFGAGRPLIHTSTQRAITHPSIIFYTVGGFHERIVLPVGMLGRTGAKYVTAYFELVGAGNEGTIVVSVRTLQIMREADLPG